MGLQYLRARYYDPETGRFLSQDTVVDAPAMPTTLNRYTYARSNPVNATGPSRLCGVDVAVDAAFIAYELYRLVSDIVLGVNGRTLQHEPTPTHRHAPSSPRLPVLHSPTPPLPRSPPRPLAPAALDPASMDLLEWSTASGSTLGRVRAPHQGRVRSSQCREEVTASWTFR